MLADVLFICLFTIVDLFFHVLYVLVAIKSIVGPPADLPVALRQHGCLLRKMGDYQRLVRHWLRGESLLGITEETMKQIMACCKIELHLLGETTPTRRSYLWSLIVDTFPTIGIDSQTEILTRMLGPYKAKHVPDKLMLDALGTLPEDERKGTFKSISASLEHADMEARFTNFVSRKGGENAQKEWTTPHCLKQLIPPHNKARLVWDNKLGAFEAYYPAGKPTNSTSKTYESTFGFTKLECLQYCVDYLWTNQAAKNREP